MAGASRADQIVGERNQLGKYQLIRRLATGGMAEIYLARATAIEGFEKIVVLKRILPQHAENDSFIRMFLAEARLAATLHHPNIVQVYDIGEDQGTYFFTMEYVQGVDLRRLASAARRAQRGLPLQHVLYTIAGVCAGLHYAHEKKDPAGRALGIVHRDVSPSNVLVTFDGGVKIVDFGIAKAANITTTAGTLKGKIPYMSPEQCRSEQLDRRSDVFSIGTLLWELTTGVRLFRADSELAILSRVAQGDVTSPRAVRPDYPPALESIVMRALEPDLDRRYPSAQALQLALEDFAHEARLPLSASRFQPFIQDVCAEQIAKLDAVLAAHHHRASGSLEATTSVSETAGSESPGTPGPSSEPLPRPIGVGQDVTASHITPGPDQSRSSVTVVPADPRPQASPPRSRGIGLGIALGLLSALGLAAVGWVILTLDRQAAPGPESAPAERSEPAAADGPATPGQAFAPPDRTSDADPPGESHDVAGAVARDADEAAATHDTDEGTRDTDEVAAPDGDETADGRATTAAPVVEPDASATKPKARSRKTRRGSGKRSTSRPPSGKSNDKPASSKDTKPKWDPKAAPPPGL